MRSYGEDGYVQDPIAPLRIEHRVDFGDLAPDATGNLVPGHYYNFLTYEFQDGERWAEAVSYLDERKTVILRVLDPPDWTSEFALRVLVFLRMRFDRVEGLAEEGGARPYPLPPDILEAVLTRMAAHIRAEAT